MGMLGTEALLWWMFVTMPELATIERHGAGLQPTQLSSALRVLLLIELMYVGVTSL
jgi:hypothetical protein